MSMNNLSYAINPRTIAVVGASSSPEKVGYQILNNIVASKFGGEVFPVNPKDGEILGLKTYKNVNDIDKALDLVVIAVPKQVVMDVINSCVTKKVKSIIVITAGFSEIGDEGKEAESQIVDICRRNNICLIGPNCLGIINTSLNLNATFAKSMPDSGPVSFVSQSGAIISSMIDLSKSSPIGFEKIFSLGNKAQVGENEILEFLYNDAKTKVIIGYLESLDASEELTKTLIKYAKKKPTIILFGGKSSFGAAAAKSHTGSIVSSYITIQTYLEQAGIILADNLEELLIFARAFSSYQSISGKNIAIITNAGGPGIAASDALSFAGLELAKISNNTIDSLAKKLRPEANIKNPIDVLGDASDLEYKAALDIVSRDSGVDGILLLLTPQTSTKIAETAAIVANYSDKKPLLSSFVGGEILSSAKEIIESSGKPCFAFPEEAVLSLKALTQFSLRPQELHLTEKSHAIFDVKSKEDNLKKFHLPTTSYSKVSFSEELMTTAEEIGYPVVLKNADPEAHKTDTGGVVVNIKDAIELKKASLQVGFPAIIGKMILGKFELFLGVKKDPKIGTTVIFGTGGIFAEIYDDFSYSIAPISKSRALEMIASTKIGKILSGARGQKKYDLEKLSEIIVNSVKFVDNFSNIAEVDFNPIIVDDEGFHMVDVRIITK